MDRDLFFPVTIGVIDGIISAIMISANALISRSKLTLLVALDISIGSSFVSALSYLIAEYGKLRSDAHRVEIALRPGNKDRQRKHLFRSILLEALYGGGLSLLMGFLGASSTLIPYSLGLISPLYSIIISYAILGLVGALIGKVSGGSALAWSMALVISGILITILGNYIRIVG
ncbi:hypothetical protein [Caldiplasma sukawensis]